MDQWLSDSMRRPEPCQAVESGNTTPNRAPSILGLDLSPETLELLNRFVEPETDLLHGDTIELTTNDAQDMEDDPEVPMFSGNFRNLVVRSVSPVLRRQDGVEPIGNPRAATDGDDLAWAPESVDVAPHAEDELPPPYGSWEGTEEMSYAELWRLVAKRVRVDAPPKYGSWEGGTPNENLVPICNTLDESRRLIRQQMTQPGYRCPAGGWILQAPVDTNDNPSCSNELRETPRYTAIPALLRHKL